LPSAPAPPPTAAPVTAPAASPSGGAGTPPAPTPGITPDSGAPASSAAPAVQQIVNVIQRDAMGISGAQSGLSFFSPESNIECRLSRIDEMTHASSFIYDPDFVSKAVTVLGRHRFILISGEPESGKLGMAIYLANRLREDGSILEDTFVYLPHDRDVKINPPMLAEDKKLRGRIIIFRDALDLNNSSLLRLLVSGEAIGSVTRSLEKAGSYVILTASHHTLPPGCHGALQEDLRPSLPPLGEERLCSGIEALIRRFLQEESHKQWREKEVEAAIVQKIAVWARTMSRAQQFINRFLSEVLGGLPLEEAFHRFEDLIPWFRKNAFDSSSHDAAKLRLQREAWTYCLALVVAQPLGGEGVPCYEFWLIYESLRRHLLGPSRISLSRRSYWEDELQHLSHAEVVRKPATAKDVIRFKDTRAADQLWTILLTSFRSLALGLIPALLKLAEQPGPARGRAAQAIGRIGMIDGVEISRRLIFRWANEEDWAMRSLAGYLAQGALRSGDRLYRDHVLECLENLIADDKAWTAVAAYKQFGKIETALALDKLKMVADFILQRAFNKSQEIQSKLEQFQEQLAKANTEHEAIESIARIDALLVFYGSMFDQEREISHALTYALVSLAITEGPAQILETLARWSLGTPRMSFFVCLVFLQEEGIAFYLTKRKVALPLNDANSWGENSRCSALLAFLTDDPLAMQTLARFLERMYAGMVDFFSSDSSRELTHVITDYLKTWIRESLPILSCRKAMVNLTASLLRSPMIELRNRISDWLVADSAFLSGPMQAFARDALNCAFLDSAAQLLPSP
jgi:hypothetical protein